MRKKDDTDEKNNDENVVVQLGFCVDIESYRQYKTIGHRTINYNDWDGGQAGGIPSWLDPVNIPSKPLKCPLCTAAATTTSRATAMTTMNFICQLYAPLDDDDDDDDDECNENTGKQQKPIHNDAYHRTLYVFGCSNTLYHSTTCIRVLRCQLPKQNPFYPITLDEDCDYESNNEQDMHQNNIIIPRCIVCNFPSKGKCPIQQQYFCSKQHQLFYKKYFFSKLNTTTVKASNNDIEYNTIMNITSSLPKYTNSSSIALYKMTEIVVEEEPPPSSNKHSDTAKMIKTETMFPSKLKGTNNKVGLDEENDDTDDESYDSDIELEQDDLNEIVQGKKNNLQQQRTKKKTKDRTFQRFIDRTTLLRPNCQTQVLRYNRWPKVATTNEGSLKQTTDTNRNGNNNNKIDDEGTPTETTTTAIETDAYDGDSDNDDDDDNGPLWIRRDMKPNSIPCCPNCGGTRQFEFQIMPQMIHYLNNTYHQNNTTECDQQKKPQPHTQQQGMTTSIVPKTMVDAIQQVDDLVQTVPPELISPQLIEAKNAAIERIRTKLSLSNDDVTTTNTITKITTDTPINHANNNININGNNQHQLNWGVIVVYTCTNSCIAKTTNNVLRQSKEQKSVLLDVVNDEVDHSFTTTTTTDTDDDDNNEEEYLGSYIEEFAWVQASM